MKPCLIFSDSWVIIFHICLSILFQIYIFGGNFDSDISRFYAFHESDEIMLNELNERESDSVIDEQGVLLEDTSLNDLLSESSIERLTWMLMYIEPQRVQKAEEDEDVWKIFLKKSRELAQSERCHSQMMIVYNDRQRRQTSN